MISKKNNQFPYFKNIFPYLMETIEELIIIVSMDNSYKIEYVHKSEYSKQLGYLEDTLQGKSLFDLINFGELNSKTDILGNLLNNGNNIEVNIINKNGNLTWALLKSSIINDAQNQQKLLLILRDISRIKDLENKLREAEKKKDVERKLEESEEKFRTIAEQSLMGICIIQDFMIKYSNQQISKIYGYTFEEISQWEPKELLKVIHPDSREMVETYLKRNQQESEKIAIHYIIKIIKKNGNIRYIENYSKPIRFQGKMADLITQVDITARINAEHKIDSSEEKYQRILENMMDGYYETDLSGKLLYANAAFCKILGYSKEEMIGKDNRSYFDNKSSVILFDIFSQVYKTGIPHPPSGFIKVMTLKKKLIYVEGSIDLLYDSEGKKVGFYGIVRDITERKIAEQKLRESEVKYRHLYENSPNSIILFNLKGEMLDCNLITESLSGFKREELIGKKYRKASFFHKDYLPILLEEFKSLLKKKMIEPIEIQLYTKKGSLIWANVQASLFDYQNEKIIQVIIQPIDDIKKAEEKFRNIAEQSLMGIFILQNGFFKYFNDKIDDITGYTREEMKNWVPYEFLKLVHPEDKEFVSEQARKKQAGDPDAIDQYNFRLIRKDNEIRWIEILSKSIDYKGSPADLAMIYDITDKIDTQKKLKESEEKFSKAFNAHSSAMLITSLEDGKVIELNDAFSKYFGIKREKIIGKTTIELNLWKSERIRNKAIELVNEREIIFNLESSYKTKQGKIAYVVVSFIKIIINEEPCVLTILNDITDKIKAEQEFKESEEKYHYLFETSPDGVILSDLKGTIIECNSAIKYITGYAPTDLIGKRFMDFNQYLENGLKKLLDGYSDLLEGNKLKPVEFPLRTKDNQIRWIGIRSTLINMKGQSYILAVVRDITIQKETEDIIKRNEKRFRDMLETSSVGVIEFDVVNDKIKYINPKLMDIIGYSENELIDEQFYNKIVHPKDLPKILESTEKSELEFRIFDKFEKLKWLSGKKIPHYDNNGQFIGMRLWVEDITEKKIYENLIYELNINFLNFTADIKNNIQLLLSTCLNLLNGDFILYVKKTEYERQESYQVLTSDNKSFSCNAEFFTSNLFVSALFYESHDFPQTFFDINRMNFANTDPFIAKYDLTGCFGKLIKSQNDLDSAVCVFYRENPAISNQDKLVMFLICDAIEIEQRRWQVQKGLEEQNITLNKINNLKTELFSRTSHELKTPLISIKGFTELLLTLHKSKLDNEVISILGEIKDGSNRLEKIINLLLESTKLEAGQLDLNLSKEDLSFLINFCVKELKGLAKLRDQSIILQLHNKLVTQFDKERIYEVFSNLLVNAIKYTPPGGNITIKSTIKDDFYIIAVKDTGIGFTKEEKQQAFKQFGKIERYGQGWDVAIEGTGLGLYITKKLVELHGGKIWLESEGRNKGTTFYFSIPKK